MRLIGWAIALAAAGLTPAAAAQAPASSPSPNAAPRQPPHRRRRRPATAQDADQARRGPAGGRSRNRRPHDPDAGRSASPTAARASRCRSRRSARKPPAFHNNWLLPLCAVISIFVLGLLLYAMVRFRRSANPTPSRNSHNTVIEVVWTLVPVLILVAIAIPVDPPAAPPIYAAARRRDGQGHRPPMVLVATSCPTMA